jgi:hypothetical protein
MYNPATCSTLETEMKPTDFLDAMPSPAVDLFVQMREDKTPRLVAAGIQVETAPEVLLRFGVAWTKTKAGRTFKSCAANGYERFLCFSDGKVAGSVFAEVVPV